MKYRLLTIVAAILLVIGAGGAVFWFARNNHDLRFPGVVEVQEVRLGSKVGGRVDAVLVHEGNLVYKNQALIVFEAPELKNQKQQMQAKLRQAEAEWKKAIEGPRWEDISAAFAAYGAAQARYERVKTGWREEEKKQAKFDLDTAQADYEQALKEWNRVAGLFRQQATSRLDYEAALAARDRTLGRVNAARARHQMIVIKGSRVEDIEEAARERDRAYANFLQLQNGTRWEDKQLAKAKVDEIRAAADAIDINIAETTVAVPPNLGKAIVEVVAVRPGDLVPPNQPVVRVLRVEDLWVKIFVPETQYGHVTLHKKVKVTIDSNPGQILEGEVIQRSNVAEFTPRNVQSVDERHHQVFAVKIRVDDPRGVLNAGMAAEVTIPRD
ncbi:MAG: efflux RND transporter periplasmic adaptor subunit [Planctomycetes bacterium]|nr:efflux RND transporter periplasmic adaptor subunit [Planctomycetota bacterium]